MPSTKLDVWDWLALALFLLCVAYVGALMALLHYRPDLFGAVNGWLEALPANPNRLVPFAYPAEDGAPPGYLVARQVNPLLPLLVGYYLLFRIRGDAGGREPISGPDLLFGAVSIVALPPLVVAANVAPDAGTDAVLGSRVLGVVHVLIAEQGIGGGIYFVGCVILANGITYVPAYIVSSLMSRARRRARARRRKLEAGSGPGALARAGRLEDIRSDPTARALVRDATDTARVEASAKDVLAGLRYTVNLPVSLTPLLVEQYSKDGVRNVSARAWRADVPYGYAVVGLLASLAQQNLEPTEVTESSAGKAVRIDASIPSSASSWVGALHLRLEGSQRSYSVEGTVVFPGQLLAWGRGRRILRTLERDMARYAAELARLGA